MDDNQAAQRARDSAMQMSQGAGSAAQMCKDSQGTANGLAAALEKLGQAMGDNAGWRAVAVELAQRLTKHGETVDLVALGQVKAQPIAGAVGQAFGEVANGARSLATGFEQIGSILDKHAQAWKQEANVWHSAIDAE